MGRVVIILGPNIKYAYKEYWAFFDHYTPLSHKSLIEILQILSFRIDKVSPQFLSYTTKSKIPKNAILIKLYLKLPFIWKLIRKQMFILERKPC